MRGRMVLLEPDAIVDEDPETTLDRQIVEVPEQDEVKPTPKKATYQADRTVRVKKQSRSKRVAKANKRKGTSALKVTDPSKVQSATSKSAEVTTAPKQQDRLALLEPRAKRSPTTPSKRSSKSHLFDGAESRLLLPATSMKNAIANIQALDGGFATDDHLPEVERADSTLLNADKYRYADFFYRVKNAVRNHWHPASVYRTRDPSGKVYGVKDRHTVLRVTLDSKGSVLSILTRKDSGLEFLDQEARAAFRRAQPFTNPPEGLVKNGEIAFEFGFYFEISSGRHGFRWKQL
jgi:TonB family protein